MSTVTLNREIWENPVKKLLSQGNPAIGITLTVGSAEIAAQAAACGFDFLWIEMEHSPITLESLRNMVLATRGLQAVPFARVPVNEAWTAKRVLDAGVLGVMFPFTSTAQLARQAVEACKYPPCGRRGSGAGLATFRWPSPEGYYDFADQNVMVIVIIDDAQGLEEIEAITATPGVDVIFVGTSDLAFSLGCRGQQDHPKVREALKKIVDAAKRNHKVLGAPATDSSQVKSLLDEGFLFFQTATELGLMALGARRVLDPFEKFAAELKTRPLY